MRLDPVSSTLHRIAAVSAVAALLLLGTGAVQFVHVQLDHARGPCGSATACDAGAHAAHHPTEHDHDHDPPGEPADPHRHNGTDHCTLCRVLVGFRGVAPSAPTVDAPLPAQRFEPVVVPADERLGFRCRLSPRAPPFAA